MTFLIGGANSLTAGYDIDNSLRFNAAGEDYLVDTSLGTATSTKIGTVSVWCKLSGYSIGGANTDGSTIIGNKAGDNDYLFFRHKDYQDTGQLLVYGKLSDSVNINLLTTAVFRDPTAWYHFVLAYDTTQGTAANRMKLYVNGTQITAFDTATYPAEDAVIRFNGEDLLNIGRRVSNNSTGYNYFSGYMADFNFVDGLQLTPSNFGETDSDSGIWKPKKPNVSEYGTNGFFLEFKGTGTSQNASGMGADTSGKGNHLAIGNLAADSVVQDTPTNNFCTLNNIGPGLTTSSASVANESLSEGNTGLTGYDGSSTVASTMAVTSGKWYVEYKLVDVQNAQMGICGGINRTDDYLGNSAHAYGYITSNSTEGDTGIYNNNSLIDIFRDGNQTDGQIHMLAFDLDNNKLWIGQNGTWKNSSDPTDSSGGGGQAITAATSTGAGDYTVGFRNGSADAATSFINFGCPAYANASSQSDANGYGDFEFAPPSGYYALCTKNLAEYG